MSTLFENWNWMLSSDSTQTIKWERFLEITTEHYNCYIVKVDHTITMEYIAGTFGAMSYQCTRKCMYRLGIILRHQCYYKFTFVMKNWTDFLYIDLLKCHSNNVISWINRRIIILSELWVGMRTIQTLETNIWYI